MQTSVNLDVFTAESFHILKNSNSSIAFRFLRPGDQPEVKSLCNDWFPIEYPDKWFNDIVEDKKYFSLAACDAHTQKIIALIIANLLPLSNCNREDQQILHKNFSLSTPVCYILILGVLKEYRRQGLASILLEHLISALCKYDACKAIYLHVLYSNKQAIKFYESKLFQYRTYLPYYYLIKNEYLHAYCFVRYINGGYPPFTFSDFLSNVQICLMKANPCHLINILRHFAKKTFIFTDSYQHASSHKEISRII